MGESASRFLDTLLTFSVENILVWKCCVIALVISLASMPLIIKVCRKRGWYDKPDERKVHNCQVPRLGGMGFVLGFVLGSVVYMIACKEDTSVFIPFTVAGLIIFAVGIADDIRDLPAIVKLISQCIAAAVIVGSGRYYRSVLCFELPACLGMIATFVWIVGVVNAYNLIDGIDGLCGGLSVLTILAYGLIFTHSDSEGASLCFLLAAAVIGFLPYNIHKAKIFMGDGGSQFLGLMVAVLPLIQTTGNFEGIKALIALNLVAIPVVDMIAAIWRRIRDHKKIMSPDRSHLHHKLMNLGLKSSQVLVLLLAIQAFLCIVSGISVGLIPATAYTLLSVTFVLVLIFFSFVHFLNKARKEKKVNLKRTIDEDGQKTFSAEDKK